MNKYTCTMSTIGSIHFVTLIAENEEQARQMAMAETKLGQARDWSVRTLEAGVPGPARALASGQREA